MLPLIKKRATHRIKIIEGQLRGIENMIEKEEYCVDILTQSLAVQKSLGSLNRLLLENHLRTHASDHMTKSEDMKEKTIEELLTIYSLSELK